MNVLKDYSKASFLLWLVRNLDDQEYLNAKKEDYWLGGTKQPPTDSAQLKKKI